MTLNGVWGAFVFPSPVCFDRAFLPMSYFFSALAGSLYSSMLLARLDPLGVFVPLAE